ncbi:hypothetical protein LY76DRAFT_76117 [Colletotrichum caudatum]|nr:hypothetical protein LY76DRAFT_76117 [Colletotrichum caudatum]
MFRPRQILHPLREHSPAIDKAASQSWSAPLPIQDFDQIRPSLSGELGSERSRPMPPRRRAAVGAGPRTPPPRPPTPPSHALSSLNGC